MKSGDLVFLDTAEGSELFHSAEVKNHFWSVGRYFETQLFLTYCGIASSVMVLNSLAIDAPEDPQIYPSAGRRNGRQHAGAAGRYSGCA